MMNKKMGLFFIGVLISLGMVNGVNSIWWNSHWIYKKQITLTNRVNGGLIDFPTNISINTTELYNAGKLQADCDDLRFINESSSVGFPYEIEDCVIDGSNRGLTTVWLKANYTSLGNTQFYMYYGNLSVVNGEEILDVWDNDYKMIHHFTEISSLDSVGGFTLSNYYNGGVNLTLNDTPYGKGVQFYNDGYAFADNQTFHTSTFSPSTVLGSGNNFTVEYIIKPHEPKGGSQYIHKLYGSTNSGSPRFYFSIYNFTDDALQYVFGLGGEGQSFTTPLISFPNDDYLHIVTRYDGTYGYVTLNGGVASSHNFGVESFPSQSLAFFGDATLGASKQGMNGTVDELRISDISRSDDWVNATYLGMSVSFGSEETETPPTTTTTTTTTTPPTTTTTTTPPTTTTTISIPLTLGNYTGYYCSNPYLVKNITTLSGNETVNSSVSIYEYTDCDYNCSETIFGIRCNYSPFVNGFVLVITLMSGLLFAYVLFKILQGFLK